MISIITPTYNREVLVQTTIKSIQHQTFKNWELIIVDDGSTDNTEAVIREFLTDNRIKYVKKKNTGQAESLNVGAALAKGEFITFLDSDDEAYPLWLQTVHENLQIDTGILCTAAKRKLLNGELVDEHMNQYRINGNQMRLKFTCGSLFIRKNIFDTIGGYDHTMKSNIQTDLGFRLIAYLATTSFKIVTLDHFLVQINIHDGPRIRTNWNRRKEGGVQFIKKHFQFLYENDKKELANFYSSIAFCSYKLRHRIDSCLFLSKAIWYNPSRPRNYLRLVKYAFL